MTSSYTGHYSYNNIAISVYAPHELGVYYIGYVDDRNVLIPMYIGRAAGSGVSIRSRLIDHLREVYWSNVTHFGYVICSTPTEAIAFESAEILRLQPQYNIHGKN